MRTWILLSAFFGLQAMAQTENKSPVVIGIFDNCGYCSNHDYEAYSCVIHEDGNVIIEDKKLKKAAITTQFSVSTQKIEQLKKLIEASRNAKVKGKAQTYSGDAPSFGIYAYPETEQELQVELYSDGKEVLDSKDARKLARQSADVCNMQMRRLKWKYVKSKIGM